MNTNSVHSSSDSVTAGCPYSDTSKTVGSDVSKLLMKKGMKLEEVYDDPSMKSAAQAISRLSNRGEILFECDDENINIYTFKGQIQELKIPDEEIYDLEDFFKELSKPRCLYHPNMLKIVRSDDTNTLLKFDQGSDSKYLHIKNSTATNLIEALKNHQICIGGRPIDTQKRTIYLQTPKKVASVPIKDWHSFMKQGQEYFYDLCEEFIEIALGHEETMRRFQFTIQTLLKKSFYQPGQPRDFAEALKTWKKADEERSFREILIQAIQDIDELDTIKDLFEERFNNAGMFSMFGQYDLLSDVVLPNNYAPRAAQAKGWELAIQGTAIKQVVDDTISFILEEAPEISNEDLKKQTIKCALKLEKVFLPQSLSRGGVFTDRARYFLKKTGTNEFDIDREKQEEYRNMPHSDGASGCPIQNLAKIWSSMTKKYIKMLVDVRKDPDFPSADEQLDLTPFM